MKDEELTGPGGIIYNVTVKVEAGAADAWLDWMINEYAPAVLNTGCFADFKVVRLLEVDDTEGPTYAIQYHAESIADYNRYAEFYDAQYRKKAYEKWGERFIAFHSIMRIVK
ncbi:MAG TPA: DUF4286 family protein [Flavisolibacter sp.]|nr:DUF4286 family protein [Flavisolibacter sp.]